MLTNTGYNTMEADICVDALEGATQGAQFTTDAFTGILKDPDIRNSMDGKGRRVDDVFMERLRRSLQYEEMFLKAYDSVAAARLGIGNYFRFYNCERTHQSLDWPTPDQVYEGSLVWPLAA